jgi:hypothetical protein
LGSSRHRFVALTTLALGFAGALEAQGFRVQGTVVRVDGTDTVGVEGVWASLHVVTTLGGTVLDSQLTMASGAFEVTAAQSDTLASYLVSVENHGIAYFSDPFRSVAVFTPTIIVYDTASTGPPIVLNERHVILQPIETDGTRRVIELFVLQNEGAVTRVTADTSVPVWQAALPGGVYDFEVGTADVSAEAIYRRGDTVAVAAPIPPGERQILITYVLPRNQDELSLPLDQVIRHVNVLVADSNATVTPVSFGFRGWETIETTPYQRFGSENVTAGGVLTVKLADVPVSTDAALWILIPLVAAAMTVVLIIWWRKTPATAPVRVEGPEALAAQIAALERARLNLDPEEFAARRAVLKQRLVDALAHRRDAM